MPRCSLGKHVWLCCSIGGFVELASDIVGRCNLFSTVVASNGPVHVLLLRTECTQLLRSSNISYRIKFVTWSSITHVTSDLIDHKSDEPPILFYDQQLYRGRIGLSC